MLATGTSLGPYRILSHLGAGGMGEVYRARDSRLGRDVALKVLSPDLAVTPEARARLEHEARTLSQLEHPHICTLFDVGEQDGVRYLVMELLEGETLARHLQRGPMALGAILRIGAEIAEALERAHRAGVVHRDLKPGNVMLTRHGVKLLDFGLARGARAGAPDRLSRAPTMSDALTAQGTILGTFPYMAPEQLDGREADARSDVWALGCLLYEMASGQPAFAATSPAGLIAAILGGEPRPIHELRPDAPPALVRLVAQCLAKDPGQRVQSAHDLMLQLQWIADAGPPDAAGVPVPARSKGGSRIAWAAAALVVVVAAALAWALRPPGVSPGPQPQFTAVTYHSGSVFNAGFAPDGRTIVYSGAPEGNTPRLFIIRPEYPEPRSFGDPGTHLLSVSSRGELAVLTGARYIAHRLFTGTLARMPLDGGAAREILEHVREADWTPDGSHLAIVRDVGGRDRLEFPIGHVLVESGGYLSDPRVSPRGDRIAFFEHPNRYDDLGSVNVVDLQGRRSVLSDGYWGEEGIAWSPDGREIFFSASLQGPSMTVYAVTLTGRRRVALQSAGGQTLLDISAGGRWLTSRDDETYRSIVHVPPWTEDRDLSWLDTSLDPMLSSDGRTVVFDEQSAAVGPNYAVCLRRTDGGSVVRLGEGKLMDLADDGGRVLAQLHSPTRIVIYPTGAGEPLRLARGNLETCSEGWWFPGGDSVLLSGNEPDRPPRFFVQRLSGGPPRAITPEGTHDGVLSADGRFVLAKGFDERYSIHPLSGSERRPVAGLDPDEALIRTTADGRSAVVSRPNEIPLRVERVELATGRRTPVATIAPADLGGVVRLRITSLSEDERSYAYWAYWRRSTLFTVSWEKS